MQTAKSEQSQVEEGLRCAQVATRMLPHFRRVCKFTGVQDCELVKSMLQQLDSRAHSAVAVTHVLKGPIDTQGCSVALGCSHVRTANRLD